MSEDKNQGVRPIEDAGDVLTQSLHTGEDEVVDTVETHFENSLVTSCPACAGNMVFNPEGGNLKCPYCGTEKDIASDNKEIEERCFETALAEGVRTWNDDDIKSFSCKSCGAELIFDAHTQAQFCNYCGSSHITFQEAENTIPPQYLVPFTVTEKEAGNRFKEWIVKRWFAPNDLKNSYKNNKLLGTYIPHWTYDSNTYSYYTAQRGDYYYVTRTRTVNGKTETYQERRTRWTPVSGDYKRFFDDVLIRASKKVDEGMINKIQPFGLNELVGYKPEYLSGFFAERYSVSLEEGWEDGKREINQNLEMEITRRIGGDTVRFLNIQTQYNDVTFKHILLPVWLSSFNYHEKVYQFMINGQSGRVIGEYPKSAIKITLAVIAGLLVAGAIAYFVLQSNDQNVVHQINQLFLG